jgi:hypothetical protein
MSTCPRDAWGLKTQGTATRGHPISRCHHITPFSQSKCYTIDTSAHMATTSFISVGNCADSRRTSIEACDTIPLLCYTSPARRLGAGSRVSANRRLRATITPVCRSDAMVLRSDPANNPLCRPDAKALSRERFERQNRVVGSDLQGQRMLSAKAPKYQGLPNVGLNLSLRSCGMSQYGLAAATVRIPTPRPAQSDREQLSGAEALLGKFRGRSSTFLRGYSSCRSTWYSSMRSHNSVR